MPLRVRIPRRPLLVFEMIEEQLVVITGGSNSVGGVIPQSGIGRGFATMTDSSLEVCVERRE